MPPKKVRKEEIPEQEPVVEPTEDVELNDNLISKAPIPIPDNPQEEIVQVDDEKIVISPPPERLLTARALVSFTDGNLREAMEKYGYECEWRMNEVRRLPKWLIQRCVNSGAELERADG